MNSSFAREYCPSYCDDRGTFHPGFKCSHIEIEDTGDTLFCCGTPDKPYCCHDADLQLFEVPGNSSISACPDSYRWNRDYLFTFIPVIVVIWIVYYVCKNCGRPRQHARSNTNQVQQTTTENANSHPRSSDSPPDTPPIAFYLTQYNGTGNGIVMPGDITLPPSYDDVVMPSAPHSAIWGQTNEAFQPDDTTTATSDNHSPHNSSHHSSIGSNNRIHPSPPSYSSLPLEAQSTVVASSSTTPSTSPSTTSTLDLSTSQPPHDDDTNISTNNVAAAPAANGDVTEHVTQTSPPRHVTSIGAIDSNAHARTETIFSATSTEAEDTVIEMQSLAQSSSLTDSSYEDSSDDA